MIQLPSKYHHPRRGHEIKGFILHTTGTSNLEGVLNYYQNGSHGIGPHYLITDDDTYQFVDDSRCAYHCGYSKGKMIEIYKKGLASWTKIVDQTVGSETYSGYQTWINRWPGKESPLELFTGTHPNDTSIGIELLEPKRTQPRKFFDKQYDHLRDLLNELSIKHNIPLDRNHVVGHYDVDPINRSSKHGDRDPGEAFDWSFLK